MVQPLRSVMTISLGLNPITAAASPITASRLTRPPGIRRARVRSSSTGSVPVRHSTWHPSTWVVDEGWLDVRTAAPRLQLDGSETRAAIGRLAQVSVGGARLMAPVAGVPDGNPARPGRPRRRPGRLFGQAIRSLAPCGRGPAESRSPPATPRREEALARRSWAPSWQPVRRMSAASSKVLFGRGSSALHDETRADPASSTAGTSRAVPMVG